MYEFRVLGLWGFAFHIIIQSKEFGLWVLGLGASIWGRKGLKVPVYGLVDGSVGP